MTQPEVIAEVMARVRACVVEWVVAGSPGGVAELERRIRGVELIADVGVDIRPLTVDVAVRIVGGSELVQVSYGGVSDEALRVDPLEEV